MRTMTIPIVWGLVAPIATLVIGLVMGRLFRKPIHSKLPSTLLSAPIQPEKENALLQTFKVVGFVVVFLVGFAFLLRFTSPNQWERLTDNGLKADGSGGFTGTFHQPLWTFLTTAAVPLIGGIVALYQYNRSHQQKSEQFKKEQDEKNIQFEKSEQQKREQFERDALENQFNIAQEQFTSQDIKTRAYAAIKLGDLAEKYSPSSVNSSLPVTYPFFSNIGSYLAVALTLEPESKVRDAILSSIRQMAVFAKKEGNPILLADMMASIIASSLSSRATFLKSLAKFSNLISNEEEMWDEASNHILFTNNKTDNISLLKTLSQDYIFKSYKSRHLSVIRQIEDPEEKNNLLLELLPELEIHSSQFISSLDAGMEISKMIKNPDMIDSFKHFGDIIKIDREFIQEFENYTDRVTINYRKDLFAVWNFNQYIVSEESKTLQPILETHELDVEIEEPESE